MSVFLSSFISLLIIVDPPGSAAVFAALAKDKNSVQRKMSAFQAVVISSGILILAAMYGKGLLNTLDISLDAIRIGGGILLLLTAYEMMFNTDDKNKRSSKYIAIYPMGTHLLAGPGCMSVVIISMSTAAANDHWQVILAILSVQIIALIAMVLADKIVSRFGDLFAGRLARIMGVVLGYLAVSMIFHGVSNSI